MNDLKFALRSLLKTPGFTVVTLLTLALCIGANSAIFSVIHAILLKPYPWHDSERLVYCYNTYPLMGVDNAGSSIPDYLDRRAGVTGFADAALYHWSSFNLGGTNEPERIVGIAATPSLFSTLESPAALGRTFTDNDAQPGRERVIVLSHALWKNRFGADRSIIGRTIRLNTETYTVAGVMPEGFYFPTPVVQAWVPFVFTDAQRSDNERGHEFSTMIARLKPGATLASVQSELNTIQAQNAQRLPGEATFWKTAGFGGRVVGFLEQNVAGIRSMLWLVQAGVAAALLIGCANVASLLLARAVARERELAIRAALGASRGRLVRLLLTESVLLFLAGGAGGLLVALWGVGALNSLGLSTLPRAFGVRLDFAVFAFTMGCALVASVIFGALPAWSAARGDAAAALKEASTRGTAGRRTQRLRTTLVVTEIALAVMLLSTAGLLVKSFARLQEQTPGFVPGGVVTARLDLPAAKYDRPEKILALHDATVARLGALPGVTAVGFTNVLPFSGNNNQGSYSSPEIQLPPGAPLPHAQIRSVDVGYLRALGLTLQRGRWFTASDTAGTERVVVIDRVLADRYWPGQDPIGRHLSRNFISGGPTASKVLWTIVGVVAPVKTHNLEENVSKETIYFPFAQEPDTSLYLVVKTAGEPTALAASVRAAVRAVDPEQPVYEIKTMTERMADTAQPRRAPMVLLSLFSTVALLLAALGIYGVLAFSVAQRTTEFGVRLALGAMPRDIAALVLRQGTWLIVVGVTTGLAGYLALSRIIARLLYDVSASDPAMLALAPLVLAVVALLACWLPTRRATKVDPMVALRAE